MTSINGNIFTIHLACADKDTSVCDICDSIGLAHCGNNEVSMSFGDVFWHLNEDVFQ